MDQITFGLLVLSIACACISVLTLLANSRKSRTNKLPPGPRPIPIIGNLLELGERPHKSLANLSKIYGPIMSLKLGSTTNIVISSPKFAKEVLQKNDQYFSSRAVSDSVTGHNHHKYSVVWLHLSPQWKNLRKICTMQLFSMQRLNSTQALRREKVEQLLDHVQESSKSGQAVDIGRAAFTTSLNLLSNTFFSIDMAHYHLNLSHDFKSHIWSMMELVGKPNVSDFFPSLKYFDLQGVRRQGALRIGKLLAIFDAIVNQRLKLRDSTMTAANNDVLDALLNLADDISQEFRCSDIKHLLLDLFIAGTDTTSSTLEWAMAELLQNPIAMSKARNELQQVLGKEKQVHESDISNLPYLQTIVKETLRLHPPAPLLIPHRADIEMEIDGFTVSKDAKVLVNAWAIGRDSSIWENPNSFVPERFLNMEVDVKGRDFELIPFGAGRRICPGLPLAHRMVHLMLASLLHSFDWKLPDGLKPEDIDMSDKFGITLQKAVPLQAIPIRV